MHEVPTSTSKLIPFLSQGFCNVGDKKITALISGKNLNIELFILLKPPGIVGFCVLFVGNVSRLPFQREEIFKEKSGGASV